VTLSVQLPLQVLPLTTRFPAWLKTLRFVPKRLFALTKVALNVVMENNGLALVNFVLVLVLEPFNVRLKPATTFQPYPKVTSLLQNRPSMDVATATELYQKNVTRQHVNLKYQAASSVNR